MTNSPETDNFAAGLYDYPTKPARYGTNVDWYHFTSQLEHRLKQEITQLRQSQQNKIVRGWSQTNFVRSLTAGN